MLTLGQEPPSRYTVTVTVARWRQVPDRGALQMAAGQAASRKAASIVSAGYVRVTVALAVIATDIAVA